MLSLANVTAGYGPVTIIRNITLNVEAGQIACLLGANGAGKSTLVRTISGMAKLQSGTISWNGQSIGGQPSYAVTRAGIAHVPEGRLLFPTLSVYDNLMVGAAVESDDKRVGESLAAVYSLFPRLLERKEQIAATLSGGEQQMVAIGRALMSGPKLLILDEPSLGLAPHLVEEVLKVVVKLRKELGLAVLLVEQNADLALRISDFAYVIEEGQVVMSGESRALLDDRRVQEAYLGVH